MGYWSALKINEPESHEKDMGKTSMRIYKAKEAESDRRIHPVSLKLPKR